VDVPRSRAKPRYRRAVLIGAAVVVLGGGTLGLRWMARRAPEIDRAQLWLGTVERGAFAIEVRGGGTLVPIEIRWASAPVQARVERLLVQPGATVTADTILIELSNPDAELAALDAERDVGAAEAEYARLAATLDGARLAQESVVTGLDADVAMATRRAEVDAEMSAKGVIPSIETAESKDRAAQLDGRRVFERKRLGALNRGNSAQLSAQQAQVERLRALAEFRRRQLDALHVRAGQAGVVQQVAVEVGQTVSPGAPLAKVIVPDQLKAQLHVPEGSAADVSIGLTAIIDTRGGVVRGEVVRVDPAAVNGTITVDVMPSEPWPKAARPDLNVDGTIQVAATTDVLHVPRPAVGEAHATVTVFKLTGDGEAVRVPVKFGRASIKDIEVETGLVVGDRIILSDMSKWDGVDRLRVQ
jgi:HlyD family secretion protein